jgi:hypothetical protein
MYRHDQLSPSTQLSWLEIIVMIFVAVQAPRSLIFTSEKSSGRDREVVNWMSILDVNETDNSMKMTRLICFKRWENNGRCMNKTSGLPDLSYGAAFVTSIASPRLTLQPALLPVAPL